MADWPTREQWQQAVALTKSATTWDEALAPILALCEPLRAELAQTGSYLEALTERAVAESAQIGVLTEERDAARAALRETRYLVLHAWGAEPDEPSVETRDARQALMATWDRALGDAPEGT